MSPYSHFFLSSLSNLLYPIPMRNKKRANRPFYSYHSIPIIPIVLIIPMVPIIFAASPISPIILTIPIVLIILSLHDTSTVARGTASGRRRLRILPD